MPKDSKRNPPRRLVITKRELYESPKPGFDKNQQSSLLTCWQVKTAINIVKNAFSAKVIPEGIVKFHQIFLKTLEESLFFILAWANKVNKLDLMAHVIVFDSFEKRMKLYFTAAADFSTLTAEESNIAYQDIYDDILDIYLMCIIVANKVNCDKSTWLIDYQLIYSQLHEDIVYQQSLPLNYQEIIHLASLDYKVASFTSMRMYSLFKYYTPSSQYDEVNKELTAVGLHGIQR